MDFNENGLSFNENSLTRQQWLFRAAKRIPKFALALVPFGITGVLADKAKAGIRKEEISRLLNVLLQMEFILRDLYKIAHDNSNMVPPSYTKAINEIYAHHRGHILMFKNRVASFHVIEVAPRVEANFNVSGLDPESNFDDFLQLAQALEDASASLYKKMVLKIRKLNSAKLLQRFILQQHTAEARHSGYIRMIRAERGVDDLTPWVSSGSDNAVPSELQELYKNEDNFIQNEIDITTITALPLSVIQEAWDEPCTKKSINNLFVLLRANYY